MRKINTSPYCRLQTKTKIRYKTYDKRLQPVTVLDRFKFDSFWHPAHDLRQLLTECRQELRSKYRIKKLDVKAGTADGIPLVIIPTSTFPEDNFTAADLGAPRGYRYWQVLPNAGKVRLLSVWAHDQQHVDGRNKMGRKIAADNPNCVISPWLKSDIVTELQYESAIGAASRLVRTIPEPKRRAGRRQNLNGGRPGHIVEYRGIQNV